jgi:hypothetical protein
LEPPPRNGELLVRDEVTALLHSDFTPSLTNPTP